MSTNCNCLLTGYDWHTRRRGTDTQRHTTPDQVQVRIQELQSAESRSNLSCLGAFFYFLATFLYRTLVFSALFLQSSAAALLLFLLLLLLRLLLLCCCRCRCLCWPEHDVALSSNVFVQMFRGALRQRLLKIFNRKTLPQSLPLPLLLLTSTQLRLFSQTGLQKTTPSSRAAKDVRFSRQNALRISHKLN